MSLEKLGRKLAYLLRHHPEEAGLHMDSHGYVSVSELLEKCPEYTKEIIDEIVATDNKRRYAYSSDGLLIRASQGHSFPVDLELIPQTPPEILYHGTVDKFLESIRENGLQKQTRQYVHLSKDIETAKKVGARRGTPIILKIAAGKMLRDGYLFYRSENGVWLTDAVPYKYIEILP